MRMKLIAVSMEPPDGLVDLLTDLGDGQNGFGGTTFAPGEISLDDFLRQCIGEADPEKLRPGLVPQTIYWLLDGSGVAVAMVRVRHYLNEGLRINGGHIGYFVRSDKRGNGYGKEALRLALLELQKLGEPNALMTVRVDNIASIKVIEANGGKFEDEVTAPDGVWRKRFWIELGQRIRSL